MQLFVLVVAMYGALGARSEEITKPPFRGDKTAYARYMVASFSFGTMSTTSILSGNEGNAFGNIQSHAEIDGVPYFYVSELDQSMLDIAQNNQVAYTISAAEHPSSLACGTVPMSGDPESPLCPRLTVMGAFSNISGTPEAEDATAALFSAHPVMKTWPVDHSWFVGKLDVRQGWLINIYGGASNFDADAYFSVNSTATVG